MDYTVSAGVTLHLKEEIDMCRTLFALLCLFAYPGTPASAHAEPTIPTMQWAGIVAPTRESRTEIVNQGFSIESVVEDTAYGFVPAEVLDSLRLQGYEVTSSLAASEMNPQDFPDQDAVYHNYAELKAELDTLVTLYPKLAHLFSLGRTVEGREIWGLRINASAENAESPTALPGIVFMGGHHAREHLSVEMPLGLARFLLESRDPAVIDLVNRRDIFIIPQVNPDGSEFDIASGRYQSWRKNRRADNKCAGVDLNRNYSYQWGTGGSSKNNCSDVYMGPEAFSEPETQAMKRFLESRPNLKVLLSFHTYSELILYPWGHTYNDLTNARDLAAYRKMATTMAAWNGYHPQQTSDLYVASGDTTDWAYGTLGIFSFTFELSPNGWGGGGFYPGPGIVQKTIQANLKPALYLIDLADDPHRAVAMPETTLFFGR